MIDRINTIIEELTNPKFELTSTLLKVQVLAHKLKNEKLKEWVDSEVNGYENKKEIPAYRIIPTIVKGNLIQGYAVYSKIQLSIRGIKDKYNIDLNELKLYQSFSSLESMLRKEDNFTTPIPVGLLKHISNNYGPYASVYSAWRVISLNSIETVVSSIKSKLLQFMLDIADELGEGENIDITKKKDVINDLFDRNLGTGNTFNISTGAGAPQTNISGDDAKTNIAIGDNNQQTIGAEEKEKLEDFISTLKEELDKASIGKDDLEDLKMQIGNIKAQLKRDKPKAFVLKNAIDVIKGVVSGVGTHILTEPTIVQLEQIARGFGL